MKKNKVEVIKTSTDEKCYICKDNKDKNCKSCNGTGIFKDNHYILIANGMAFSMDTIK